MLFKTPRPGLPVNWDVVNSQTGQRDLVPGKVIEGPIGGARPTVRVILHRTSQTGETYYDVQSVPERFLEIRDELIDALDGTAEQPLSLIELMNLAQKSRDEFVAKQRAQAAIPLAD